MNKSRNVSTKRVLLEVHF